LFVRGVAFVGLEVPLFEAGGGHFFVDGFDGLAGGVEGEVDYGAVGAREGEGGEDLLAESLGGAGGSMSIICFYNHWIGKKVPGNWRSISM